MSDTRPTPEADKERNRVKKSKICPTDPLSAEFARKLERERDEARESKERIAKRAEAIRCELAEREKQLEAMREAIKTASDAIALQIFVRGTRDDTLDVLSQMQAAQTKLQPFLP